MDFTDFAAGSIRAQGGELDADGALIARTPGLCLTDTMPGVELDRQTLDAMAATQCENDVRPFVTQLVNQIAKRSSGLACVGGVFDSVTCEATPVQPEESPALTMASTCDAECPTVNCVFPGTVLAQLGTIVEPAFDIDGDGTPDGPGVDSASDRDALPDSIALDLNGDGIFEALDQDGDGVADVQSNEPVGVLDIDAVTSGDLGSIQCSNPDGCSGIDPPICTPGLTRGGAMEIAVMNPGDFEPASSTVDLSVTVPVFIFQVGGTGSANLQGRFSLLGTPCPGATCDVGLTFNAFTSSLTLDFADPVSDITATNLRVIGDSGLSRAVVDEFGNGYFQEGALIVAASGDYGGSKVHKTMPAPAITFHIDWSTGMLTVQDFTIPFPDGTATVNLTGHFRPSIAATVGGVVLVDEPEEEEDPEGPDTDADGIPDDEDNCPLVPNADQAPVASPVILLQGATASCSSPQAQQPYVEDICFEQPVSVTSNLPPILPVGTTSVTWTATDTHGNQTTATQTFTYLPALVSKEGISVGARAHVGVAGTIVGLGTQPLLLEPDARVGSVFANGSIALDHRSRALGNLTSKSSISLKSDSIVQGTLSPFTTWPSGTLPWLDVLPVQVGTSDVLLNPGQTLPLPPGSYRDLRVYAGATLQLSAGIYHFRSIQLEPNSQVVADGTSILAKEIVAWRGLVPNVPASSVDVYYDGTNAIVLEANFSGIFRAPKGQVSLGIGTALSFAGVLAAKKIVVRPDVVFACNVSHL